MSDVANELLIKISTDLSGLISGLAEGEKKAKKSAGRIVKLFDDITTGVRSSINTIGRWTLGLGAAGAALFGIDAIMREMSRADRIGDLASRIGTSTEELTRLGFAASQSGASLEQLSTGLDFMQRSLTSAIEGNEEAASAYRKLGLSIEQLATKDPADQFRDIAEAMSGYGTSADKAAVAQDIFGRGGKELLNTLKEGRKGLADLSKEADDLGLTLKKVDHAKIAAAMDEIDKLKDVVGATARKIGVELTPLLAYVSELLIASSRNGKELEGVVSDFSTVAITGINAVKKAQLGLNVLWEGAKVVLSGISVGFWEAVRGITKGVLWLSGQFSQFTNWLGALFGIAWESLKLGWVAFEDLVVKGFSFIIDSIGKGVQAIGSNLRSLAPAGSELEEQFHSLAMAGVDMQASMSKLRLANFGKLTEQVRELTAARERLKKANEDSAKPPDTATPELDKITNRAHEMLSGAVAGFWNAVNAAAEDGTWTDSLNRRLNAFQEFRAQFQSAAEELAKEEQARLDQRATAEEIARKAQLDRQAAFLERWRMQERDAFEANMLLWEAGFKGKMEVAGTFFNQIGALMNVQNRKAFEIGKAGAASEAAIQTYLAANKAYQSMVGIPIVGPGLAVAAAAAATIAGMANVHKIANTSYGNKGSGGSSSGGGRVDSSQTATSSQERSTLFNVTLNGDRFSGNQVRSLIRSINDQAEDNQKIRMQVN